MSFFNYSEFYDNIVKVYPSFTTYVELGVWQGHSIAHLADALKPRRGEVKLYAVDIFEAWDKNETVADIVPNITKIFNQRLIDNDVRDMITDIRGLSWEAADQFEDESVDMVFVDADHEYESVIKDINAWLPKIKTGGIISGHDIHAEGVRNAVQELVPSAHVSDQWGGVWFHCKGD
tara:strand:- start:206 stop:736 length:531 start_codon:yes stop_codon:yes gene_type:complete